MAQSQKFPQKPSPSSSSTDLPTKISREKTQQNSNLAHPQQVPGGSGLNPNGAAPRRREKKEKDKDKEFDIIKRLQQICTDADPTQLYRSLVKIGAG
jgi:p21-activated kinase 1